MLAYYFTFKNFLNWRSDISEYTVFCWLTSRFFTEIYQNNWKIGPWFLMHTVWALLYFLTLRRFFKPTFPEMFQRAFKHACGFHNKMHTNTWQFFPFHANQLRLWMSITNTIVDLNRSMIDCVWRLSFVIEHHPRRLSILLNFVCSLGMCELPRGSLG